MNKAHVVMPYHVVIAFSVISLAGCAAPQTSESLAENWANELANYKISAIFPPSADLQIGDIYVVCPRQNGRDVPNARFMGHTPGIKSALTTFYKETINYPQTVFQPPSVLKTAAPGTTETGGTASLQHLDRIPPPPSKADFLSAEGDITAMRAAVFPDFFNASALGGQGGVSLPAGIAAAGLGISAKHVTSVSMSVPRVETIQLPFEKMNIPIELVDAAENIRRELANDKDGCHDAATLVVTQIFLARAIDTAYSLDAEAAASLRVALQTPSLTTTSGASWSALKQYLGVPNSKPEITSGSGTPSSPTAASDTATSPNTSPATGSSSMTGNNTAQTSPQRSPAEITAFVAGLTAMDSAADKAMKPGFIGVDGAAYSGTLNGFSLHQEYTVPIVIGYRAVKFVYDTSNQRKQANGKSITLPANETYGVMSYIKKLPLSATQAVPAAVPPR